MFKAVCVDGGDRRPLIAVEPKVGCPTLFGTMNASDPPASHVVDGASMLASREAVSGLLTVNRG